MWIRQTVKCTVIDRALNTLQLKKMNCKCAVIIKQTNSKLLKGAHMTAGWNTMFK